MGQGLARFGDDGDFKLRGHLENRPMPIVGEEAQTDTSPLQRHDPLTHIGRHLMIGARDYGVINIQQHMGKPTFKDVGLNIYGTRTRKVPFRLQQRHGKPKASGMSGNGLLMLLIGLIKEIVDAALAVRPEAEEIVVTEIGLGIAYCLQRID